MFNHKVTILITFLACSNGKNSFESCLENNGTLLQQSVCLEANYQKTNLPTVQRPFKVNGILKLLSLTQVNLKTNFFTFMVYFDFQWKDPRIVPDWTEAVQSDKLILDLSSMKKLWKPTIYIYHTLEKSYEASDDRLLEMKSVDGTLRFSGKATISMGCKMNLEKYPFDKHKCKFIATSTSHLAKELVFDVNISTSSLIEYLTEYNYEIDPFPNPYFVQGEFVPNQNYSSFGFVITINRHLSLFTWMYFLPTICIEIIAGISFIVPPTTAIPGRLTLLVTIFLVQMGMLRDVAGILPASDTLTALSIYVLCSIFFILFALIEYGMILLTDRIRKKLKLGPMTFEKVDSAAISLYFLGLFLFNILFFLLNE